MLRFSASFPIETETTPQAVLSLMRKWVTGSPHYGWTEADLETNSGSGTIEKIQKYGQEVRLGVLDAGDDQIAALRHSWEDGSRNWVTEATAVFSEGRCPLFTARVYCTTTIAGAETPIARRPHIIPLLLREIGGGNDGPLEVLDTPHRLEGDQGALAADLVLGKADVILPCLYLSVTNATKLYVDPDDLSRDLAGIAHVIVEPSREFSFQLRDATNGRNAFGGAVGVYWSQGRGLPARYLPQQFRPGQLESSVVADITRIWREQRPLPGTNWAAIEQAEASARLEALKRDKSDSVEEWEEAFAEDQKAKDNALTEANSEIDRLRAEIAAMQSSPGSGGQLLASGNERALFHGELQEIIVSALKAQRANAMDESRTAHVLDDLLEANPVGERRSEFARVVKDALSTAKEIGNREIGELQRIDFSVTGEGKHYKAVFESDPRYTFTLPKTSSDHRAGKNLVSEITKKLFK